MKKVWIIVFLIISVILFFGTAFYKDFVSRCTFFNEPIKGRIDELRINRQNLAEIKLHDGSWFYLGTNISYDIPILKGDSIIKEKGSFKTLLIKNSMPFDISSNRTSSVYFKFCRGK
jgi:hypothetical protein